MKQLLLAISMLVSVACFAKIPTPQKDTYVNDFAKVLKPSQISALNAKIHRIERLSGVQFAVVLIDKLPDEYDIEEYTLLLARKWHVGKNKNGLVYVAAIGQRKQRLEVARKLTDKLTDSKCAEVLGVIKPYFREQDYNGGIDAMVDKLTDELVPAQPVAQQAAPVRHVQAKKEKGGFADTLAGILAAGIMLAIPALIIWLIVRAVRGNSSRRAYQQQMMYGQQPMGFNNGYGGGGYGGGPVINNYNGGGGYGSSGIGSGVGGFIAGAATGYAARTIQDHLSDHREHDQHSNYAADDSSADDGDSYDTSINDSDTDSSNWGDWGSSGGDSDSSSSDSDSSSSNSGFDGDSGATSDW